jgi:hypothetical protein
MTRARDIANLGNGVDASDLTEGAVEGALTTPTGRRNLIINGAMQVAQRGTSETGVTSSGYYTIDRFGYWISSAGTATVSQSTDAPTGFSKSFKVEMTTANTSLDAGDYQQIRTKIEAQDLQMLDYGSSTAKDLTLSFWVKSSITGTYSVGFWQDDVAKRYTRNFTIDSANTWEKKTVLITGNTANAINNDNGVGFEVNIIISAGSNYTSGSTVGEWHSGNTSMAANQTAQVSTTSGATFYLTGVQLEVGSVATPFEHRSYGEELALCQRYYWKDFCPSSISVKPFIGTGHLSPVSTARAMVFVDAPVPLRVTPSITFSDVIVSDQYNFDSQVTSIDSIRPTNGNSTKIAFQTVNASNGTANQFIEFRGKNNVDAYAAFDAEL